jgi:hypothetical protein
VKAEEIRLVDEGYKTPAGWLKEIAYQLAVMNERERPAGDLHSANCSRHPAQEMEPPAEKIMPRLPRMRKYMQP